MITRHVLFILIQISILINSILSCPIPFDIQSKCRCAITETGRVYIYCARKQLTIVPRFNNSKFNKKKVINLDFMLFSSSKAILFSMNLFYPVIEYPL